MLVFALFGCPSEPTNVLVPPLSPEPTATVIPTTPAPPASYAEFWPLFNTAACDAGVQCGSNLTLDAYGCPEGVATPTCEGFDASAAEVCLSQMWTCGDVLGRVIAEPAPACNVVCDQLQDTAPPPSTPTPIPDPTYDVTLADVNGDDTLTLTITNPPAGALEFGYGQTTLGSVQGWFGEDCFIGATCHPIPAVDANMTSTLVLTRVFNIADIVSGSTMLLPVDSLASNTPSNTYYVGTIATTDDTCVVWGHEPSYYSVLNCADPGARGTSNDN